MQLRILSLLFIVELLILIFPQHVYAANTESDPLLDELIVRRENFTTFPVTRMLRELASRKPRLKRDLAKFRVPQAVYGNNSVVPVICTTQQRDWASAARTFLSSHQHDLPEAACPYFVSYSRPVSEHTKELPTQATSVLATYSKSYQDELRRHWKSFSLWGDKKVRLMHDNVRQGEIHYCSVDINAVIAVGHPDRSPKRYFFAQFLGDRLGVATGRRKSLLEIVSTDLAEPLLRRIKPHNSAVCNRTDCKPISTEYVERTGPGWYSHLTPMELHRVPLLDFTLDEDEKKFSSANSVLEDLTVSNIAILALPLVLCFIPIATMADVSNTATFVYALITDFFSAIPIVVKGAELMIKFRKNAKSIHSETWLFGDDKIRLSETWTTHCEINVTRGTGLVIILVACWAIILGFVTEYLAWRFVSNRKRHKKLYAVLQDRNYIRKVGPDTFQIRSKYLSKILGRAVTFDIFSGSTTTDRSSDEHSVPSTSADTSRGLEAVMVTDNVVTRGFGRVGGAYVDDDQPLDALQAMRSVRSSRMSSLFLRNSNLSAADDDPLADPPIKILFMGILLGVLLPIFSYFYLHCLASIERSRRKRKYYIAGCAIGFCLWPPILMGAWRVYNLANNG